MSESRKAFEVWAKLAFPHMSLLKKGDTDKYVYKTANFACEAFCEGEAWQASRQALEGEPVTAERIADTVRDYLGDIFACTRVWEAWQVGTMTQNDFTPADETELADDIAGAVATLYTHPASAQAPEEIERDGINSTENLAYIDGYNDCAKEVRENARSNKQAVSVPDDRISVHEYTARMALQALEEYAENLSIVAGWDYEPLEHHYAQQAIEEIESLLPEPPKQEKGQ